MVMALRTDSTRVITCMICSESNGGAIPDIGISQTRHGLSHHNGDPEQLRRLTETDTFLVEQLSYFLDQLKAHQEDGQPLLDTTQVLWGSGMAYGHSHGNANLPTILAGGKALGLQARPARRFQPAEDRQIQRRRCQRPLSRLLAAGRRRRPAQQPAAHHAAARGCARRSNFQDSVGRFRNRCLMSPSRPKDADSTT